MVSILILVQISTMVTLENNFTSKKMKALYILFIMFMSCGNDKIYDKQLKNDEINVDWYHYSYITSNSPNYVVVKKEDKEDLVFEYGWGLQDVELQNDTITILHLKFYETPKVKKDSIFGYAIKYKEVSSHEMYLKHLEETKQK